MFSIKKFANRFRSKSSSKNTRRFNSKTSDLVFLGLMIFGAVALIGLVCYQVRPMQLVDIKVPVATDKAFYYPGERVSGVFFGEIFYSGKVAIYTDIFCAGYRSPIKSPDGTDIFNSNSRPIVLQGDTRFIGHIPDDVPIGKNCVIQFVNEYEIKTPFGTRHEERTYYTQNFFIREKDSEETEVDTAENTTPVAPTQQMPPLFEHQPDESTNENNDTSDESTNSQANTSRPETPVRDEEVIAPAEPVTPPQRCALTLFGLKVLCR